MPLRCKTRSGRSCLGSFLPARNCLLGLAFLLLNITIMYQSSDLWDEN